MPDQSTWDLTTAFKAKDMASLIAGDRPVQPVYDRIFFDYRSTCKWHLEQIVEFGEEFAHCRLSSVEMVQRIEDDWDSDPHRFHAWLSDSRQSGIDLQRFHRDEIVRWLDVVGLTSCYQFNTNATAKESETPPTTPVEMPWHLLATPAKLIDAFGAFTGMDKTWFDNAKDAPRLLAARQIVGQGGKNYREPRYDVYLVMRWLIDPERRKGAKLSSDTGWRRLKQKFPRVYEQYQEDDPDSD